MMDDDGLWWVEGRITTGRYNFFTVYRVSIGKFAYICNIHLNNVITSFNLLAELCRKDYFS